jgi:hypothetical protein
MGRFLAGTNALHAYETATHAYETATGTIISPEHVVTTDADLLWDTKQSLLLAATGIRREKQDVAYAWAILHARVCASEELK